MSSNDFFNQLKLMFSPVIDKLFSKHLFTLLAISALFLSGWLHAQSLFERIDAPRLSAQQQHYLQTLLNQRTTVDYMIVLVHPEVLKGDEIRFEYKGSRYQYIRTRTTFRDHDDFSWTGELNGDFGRCNLVFRRGKLTAILRNQGTFFQIFPLGEGLHVFLESDQSLYPSDCPNDASSEKIQRIKPEEINRGDGTIENIDSEGIPDENGVVSTVAGSCSLRLLVAYTDDVDASYADIQGYIQSAIDDHNDANNNSQVNHDVELARSMEVNYDESANDLDVFIDDFMTDGDGKMDAVHDDRDLFDADVCVLLTLNSGGFCGLASGIGSTSNTAFCVTVANCAVGNHSFAHEVGHLHGCRHDTYVDATNTPYAYGHGYVYLMANWRTIMAYNNECDCSDEVTPCPAFASRNTPGTPSCTRLQNWSTPDVLRDGVQMGTASTEKNERVLDETAATLAAYQGYVVTKQVFADRVITSGEEFDIQGVTSLTTVTTEPFTINSGAKGTFRAGTEITLREGFHAKNGSDFRAYLDNCTSLSFTEENPVTQREKPQRRVEESNLQVVQISAFPNPFSNEFQILFKVTQDAVVSVRLFDMQGRQLEELLSQYDAPAHRAQMIEFEGSQLSNGTYNLIIQVDDQFFTKKVVKTGN